MSRRRPPAASAATASSAAANTSFPTILHECVNEAAAAGLAEWIDTHSGSGFRVLRPAAFIAELSAHLAK